MSNFLSALKQAAPAPTFTKKELTKSAQPAQAPNAQPAQAPNAQPAQAPNAQTLGPVNSAQGNVIAVQVERVINRNRIDVRFSRKPDADTIADLKRAGFWWDPANKVWFHQDTETNRSFLSNRFGAVFDSLTGAQPEQSSAELSQSSQPDLDAEYAQQVPDSVPAIVHPENSVTFNDYRRQVDALMTSLNMSAADLMVYAIDFLYRETIAN